MFTRVNLLQSTSSTILSSLIAPVSLCGSNTTQVLWDYLIAEFFFPSSVLLNIVFWTICEYDFVPLISPSAHLAGQQRLCPLPNDPPPTIATTMHSLFTHLDSTSSFYPVLTRTLPLPTTPPLGKIWRLNVRWAFPFSIFFLDSPGLGSSRAWGQRRRGICNLVIEITNTERGSSLLCLVFIGVQQKSQWVNQHPIGVLCSANQPLAIFCYYFHFWQLQKQQKLFFYIALFFKCAAQT